MIFKSVLSVFRPSHDSLGINDDYGDEC